MCEITGTARGPFFGFFGVAHRPPPLQAQRCTDGRATGTCKDVSACQGTTKRGLCPGPASYRCCFPAAAPNRPNPPPPPPAGGGGGGGGGGAGWPLHYEAARSCSGRAQVGAVALANVSRSARARVGLCACTAHTLTATLLRRCCVVAFASSHLPVRAVFDAVCVGTAPHMRFFRHLQLPQCRWRQQFVRARRGPRNRSDGAACLGRLAARGRLSGGQRAPTGHPKCDLQQARVGIRPLDVVRAHGGEANVCCENIFHFFCARRAYTGSNPHTDHVHTGMHWQGARGLTEAMAEATFGGASRSGDVASRSGEADLSAIGLPPGPACIDDGSNSGTCLDSGVCREHNGSPREGNCEAGEG